VRLKRTDLTVIMRKLPNPVKDLIQRISQHIETPELEFSAFWSWL
jgi:Ca2+-binding EF-hand superfamily protein